MVFTSVSSYVLVYVYVCSFVRPRFLGDRVSLRFSIGSVMYFVPSSLASRYRGKRVRLWKVISAYIA